MARSISRVALCCGLLTLAATAGGCQRRSTWNLAPVEGTLAKDGHPLANIQVVFLADAEAGTQGPRASGITDESGRYRLRTDNGDEGVVVGKHHVCLFDLEAQPMTPAEKRPIPRRYGSFTGTPLRIEVRPGEQVINLEVK